MTEVLNRSSEWAQHWTADIWRASWQGGIFILAVWLACRILKKIPASTRHWLWVLASAQLLVRLIIASPISLPLLPANAPVQASTRFEDTDRYDQAVRSPTSDRSGTLRSLSQMAPPEPKTPRWPVATISIWFTGILAGLLISGKRLIRTRTLLRATTPCASSKLSELVDELSQKIGVRPPNLCESPYAPCPLLAGWQTPTIVMPTGSASSLTDSELRMAIAHELSHLKRHDLWWSLVPVASQILFFFHPLAWLSAREAAAAREESCDAMAIRLGGGSPATYARLLLNSAQSSSSAAVLGSAFGYRIIQRRITMLNTSNLSYGASARRALSILLVIGIVGALPWSVTAQSHPTLASQVKANKVTTKKSNSRAKKVSRLTVVRATPASVRAMPVAIAPSPPTFAMPSSGRIAPPAPANSLLPARDIPTASDVPRPPHIIGQIAAVAPASPGVPATPASALPGSPDVLPARNALAPPASLSEATSIPTRISGLRITQTPTGFRIPHSPVPEAGDWSVSKTELGRYNVDFEDVEIHQAIKQLCFVAHLDYMIRSDIKKDNVTMSLHNVSVDLAINTLLKSVKQPLSLMVEGGVYHFQVSE